MAITERRFAPDHPAAQGHFPGNPVIPGAVLLGEAISAIEAGLGTALTPCRIRSAKFLHPVRPGDCVRIEYSGTADEGVKFSCAVEGRAVMSGEIVREGQEGTRRGQG